MRSEIEFKNRLSRQLVSFQSSFYKDALWNQHKQSETWSNKEFQSSFYKDALWNAGRGDSPWVSMESFQSSFYKDALWNEICWLVLGLCPGTFQSSFYKDALWNEPCGDCCYRVYLVSILILQGCALKYMAKASSAVMEISSFNPHFTRMRSEIHFFLCLAMNIDEFQSSFYKDALWNVYHCRVYRNQSISFNPHFTRMRSEIYTPVAALAEDVLSFNPHFTRMRSEIIPFPEPLLCKFMFQSSFYKDALWNWFWNPLPRTLKGVSILILQGCALK